MNYGYSNSSRSYYGCMLCKKAACSVGTSHVVKQQPPACSCLVTPRPFLQNTRRSSTTVPLYRFRCNQRFKTTVVATTNYQAKDHSFLGTLRETGSGQSGRKKLLGAFRSRWNEPLSSIKLAPTEGHSRGGSLAGGHMSQHKSKQLVCFCSSSLV